MVWKILRIAALWAKFLFSSKGIDMKITNIHNKIRGRFVGIGLIAMLIPSISFADITVACAANMQYAMKDIVAAYKTKTGKTVVPVFGSSGKLSTQIQNGAPFDVFVSADMGYGDTLFLKKAALAKSKVYAYGILVLWTLKDYDITKGLALLNDPQIKSIAVGDLKLTVYGPAASQAMKNAGIWESVQPKLVFGENINTVAQYIVSQSADIGFANLSFTQQGPMAGKGKWLEVDHKLYDPLPQGAVILRYGQDNNPQEAKAFFEFLYGPETRAILTKNGYLLP